MASRRRNRKKRKGCGFFGELGAHLSLMGLVLVFSLLTGILLFSPKGMPLYLSTRETRQQLQDQIAQMAVHNAALQADIVRIQRDNYRLEELARSRLGMVRSGETVYQFVEPAPSSLTARP